MSLDKFRNELNSIDDEIIKLFEKRMLISEKIGNYKRENNLGLTDLSREKEVVNALENKIDSKFKFAVNPLYEEIFKLSKECQKRTLNYKEFEYGLIGKKLSHSKSAEIHNIIGGYDYALHPMEENELEKFFAEKKFKGINVTIPYKVEVLKYLDEISPLAQRIGSVNTIINNNGKLVGYNTDYDGFKYMCQKAQIAFKDKRVIVLGSGGASKTIQTFLEDELAKEVVVISRSGENNYDNIEKFSEFDIIINTTPVGMYPNNLECKIDLSMFKNCEAVVDIIYNPINTKLILKAKKRKLKVATGLDMLVAQAYYAAQLFLDKELPVELIESTLKKIKFDMENIVLVGMPGAGKSTIGKLLAEKLNRKFVDIDKCVEEYAGMSIPEIFIKRGEEEFRKLESETIKKFGSENGIVIATGGGTPVLKENQNAIMQNGYVIFLDRDIKSLEMEGRPLSKDVETLKQIYVDRYRVYRGMSNKTISVLKEIDKTLDAVLEGLCEDEVISN